MLHLQLKKDCLMDKDRFVSYKKSLSKRKFEKISKWLLKDRHGGYEYKLIKNH
ncbi:MAG: hypothetical protein ACLTG7_10385 [Romboutsia sp.]